MIFAVWFALLQLVLINCFFSIFFIFQCLFNEWNSPSLTRSKWRCGCCSVRFEYSDCVSSRSQDFFLECSTTLFHYYGNIPLLTSWFILHFLRGLNDITRSVLRAIGDKTLSTSSSFSHTVDLQVVVSFNVIVREYWIKINPWVVLRLYKIFKIYVRFRDSSISCWYVSPCS